MKPPCWWKNNAPDPRRGSPTAFRGTLSGSGRNFNTDEVFPMKNVNELHFPAECRYTSEHVWIRADGEEYVVGISDFAQDQLGEIAFVDLPAPGGRHTAGEEFGTVESLKSVNQLFMPVTGEITAVNEELESTPTLINVSPYGRGWLLRVRADNPADVDALLSARAYREQLE